MGNAKKKENKSAHLLKGAPPESTKWISEDHTTESYFMQAQLFFNPPHISPDKKKDTFGL